MHYHTCYLVVTKQDVKFDPLMDSGDIGCHMLTGQLSLKKVIIDVVVIAIVCNQLRSCWQFSKNWDKQTHRVTPQVKIIKK